MSSLSPLSLPQTEGLTNTLMRVVSAEFELPRYVMYYKSTILMLANTDRDLSAEAQDIISAMLRKVSQIIKNLMA